LGPLVSLSSFFDHIFSLVLTMYLFFVVCY
jgi:hypothetical protein